MWTAYLVSNFRQHISIFEYLTQTKWAPYLDGILANICKHVQKFYLNWVDYQDSIFGCYSHVWTINLKTIWIHSIFEQQSSNLLCSLFRHLDTSYNWFKWIEHKLPICTATFGTHSHICMFISKTELPTCTAFLGHHRCIYILESNGLNLVELPSW